VKGILDDRSRGVFEGLIRIAKDAQKSDSSQLSRSLLLSSGARVDTKPELDVLADDVKAAHGAAIGQLDAEQMFYLRSRGIPAETARRMLIHGFMEEIVSKVPESMHSLIAAAFVRFET
jgi:Fe-S cluster assembly protein SufD